MMNIIRDMPDWMTGTAIAGLGWFGFCYSTLTERKMEEEVRTNVMPACIKQLEAEQEKFLTRLTRDASERRKIEVGRLQDRIRSRENRLSEIIGDKELYAQTHDSVCRQLGAFCVVLPDYSGVLPGKEEIQKAKAEIASLRAELDAIPPIILPRAPQSELLSTCTCAAIQSLAGKRTDYALSLASFRLFSPEGITSSKKDLAQTLRFDACGKPSWESLS